MSATAEFAIFETPIGPCGIVWSARGIVATYLPEKDRQTTYARLKRRFSDAREATPPAPVQAAINSICALLSGEACDLRDIEIAIDPAAPEFHARVWAEARRIPPGETRTYGEIAKALGAPEKAREVGQAMGANRFPIIVPCHRVLGAGGKIGGFSAPGGTETKLRMLTIERARTGRTPTLFADLPLAAAPRKA
ncbi:MAG: methylated-DNA--[protein]-cysteine S-methyltransferase [Alphaproteobacteria bacterium]